MRLLLVSAYFETHRGGIEMVAGSLAREFQRARHAVTWIASGCDPVPSGDLSAHCVPLAIHNGTEGWLGIPFPMPGLHALKTIRREVAAADAVMIHDALYPANIAAFLFARRLGKPVLVVQHIGDVPYANPILRMLMSVMNRLVTRPALAAADQVVYISALTAEKFRDVACCRPPQIIYNGVDRDIFRPAQSAAERTEIRAQFGLSPARPLALFVGRFVEKKGLHILHQAAQQGADIDWVFVGWGKLNPQDWNLPNVRVLPGLDREAIARLYRASDVFVLPSVGEGFPLVVQEAALCGLPVICGADTARADERLQPLLLPVDLEYCDPSDVAVDVLALARQAIAGNKAEQAAARSARVSGFYSWPQSAGRYLGLFNDLPSGAARRRELSMLPSASRYFLVGLTCALLHNAIMIGGDLAGLHYVVSSAISFATVTSFGFLLHCAFTFEQRPSARSFLRYVASMAANFPASIALMFLFCDIAGFTVPVAAPLATVILFVWNFLASRWAIVGNPFRSGYQTPDGRSAAKP